MCTEYWKHFGKLRGPEPKIELVRYASSAETEGKVSKHEFNVRNHLVNAI